MAGDRGKDSVMSPAFRRGLVAFVVALIVIVGGLIYEEFQPPAEPSIGGPFTLIDQNGAAKSDRDFRGKLMLVYFGYTFCPDACPTTLDLMTRAMAKLGPQENEVAPIFVTVDPARDTPAQMKLYIAAFDPHFEALTGSPDQIARVADEYRVYFKKADGAGDQYTVDHSSVIYLMGRDGRYIGRFDPGSTAANLADALRKYL
jgi:cytochrome oxidase Cu insertion factor (SCO1/SenC/PrrC family)